MTQEVARPFVLGMAQDLLRWTSLNHLPLLQVNHPVRQAKGLGGGMGREDQGAAGFLNVIFQDLFNLVHPTDVRGRRGLIQ